MIGLENVTKIFGLDPRNALARRNGRDRATFQAETGHVVAVDAVSLDMTRGEIFVIVGLSGSGKSTLLRLINRLIDPTAGQVAVAGTDMAALSDADLRAFRRETFSMVFQRFALFPHRSVLDNAAYGLEVQGLEKATRRARAGDWLKRVGLDGQEGTRPAQLSGGMQQRVGLARALATDAPVLLMDEPFSALDPLIRREMQGLLQDLQRDLKKTIVFITHDLDEALRLGDRIAVLKDGRLIQEGRPRDIVLQPADDYVRSFVGDVNRWRVLTAEDVMTPRDPERGTATDAVETSGAAGVRPETPLEDLLPALSDGRSAVPVVTADGIIVGDVTRERLFEAGGRPANRS